MINAVNEENRANNDVNARHRISTPPWVWSPDGWTRVARRTLRREKIVCHTHLGEGWSETTAVGFPSRFVEFVTAQVPTGGQAKRLDSWWHSTAPEDHSHQHPQVMCSSPKRASSCNSMTAESTLTAAAVPSHQLAEHASRAMQVASTAMRAAAIAFTTLRVQAIEDPCGKLRVA